MKAMLSQPMAGKTDADKGKGNRNSERKRV